MEIKFYFCDHCKNVALKVVDHKVPLFCCGEKMTELVPGTVDAAVEKLLAAQEALERKDGAFAFEYDDFTFTMTNAFLPSDDGTNVNKLIQGGSAASYGKLFDGAYGRDFELLWDVSSNHDEDGELPDYVELPLTLHMPAR